MITSLGLMAVGGIGMFIVPFFESVVCGLLNLFLPFYGLYYLVTRWEDMQEVVPVLHRRARVGFRLGDVPARAAPETARQPHGIRP